MNQLKRDKNSKATAPLRKRGGDGKGNVDDDNADDDDDDGGDNALATSGTSSRAARAERRQGSKDPPSDSTERDDGEAAVGDVDGSNLMSSLSTSTKRSAAQIGAATTPAAAADKRQRIIPPESPAHQDTSNLSHSVASSHRDVKDGDDEVLRKPQEEHLNPLENNNTIPVSTSPPDGAAVDRNDKLESRAEIDNKKEKKEKKKSKIPFEQYQNITKMITLFLRQEVSKKESLK